MHRHRRRRDHPIHRHHRPLRWERLSPETRQRRTGVWVERESHIHVMDFMISRNATRTTRHLPTHRRCRFAAVRRGGVLRRSREGLILHICRAEGNAQMQPGEGATIGRVPSNGLRALDNSTAIVDGNDRWMRQEATVAPASAFQGRWRHVSERQAVVAAHMLKQPL